MAETDSDSSSDTAPRTQSPGPADPHKCAVTGAGFSGGAAGEVVALTIISKDARGLRVREGDLQVLVSLKASDPSSQEGFELEVMARDNGDGTYSASYSVPSRGNYTLSITMNGTPIGGSPFPVFFSPPQPGAPTADVGGNGPTVDGVPIGGPLGSQVANLTDGLTVAEATQALGGAIVNAVYVTSISPNVQLEQLKQLFAYCGKVANVHFIGETRETALVEYTTALEARCATGLDGTAVGDRSLRVQLGIDLASATTSGGNPYLSLQQVQQLQHVHSSNQHATQLAAQLAGLRAIARTALLPAIQDEEKKNSGRKAALAAAAELTRKFCGIEHVQKDTSPSPFLKKQLSAPGIRNRRKRRSRSTSRSHRPARVRQSRSHSSRRDGRDHSRKYKGLGKSRRKEVSRSPTRSPSDTRDRRKGSRKHQTRDSSRRHRSVSPYDKRAYSPHRGSSHKRQRGHDRSRYESPRHSGRHLRARSRDRDRDVSRKEKDYVRKDAMKKNRADEDRGRNREKRKLDNSPPHADNEPSKSAKDEENHQPHETQHDHQGAEVLEEMRKRALTALLEQKKSLNASATASMVIEQLDPENDAEGPNGSGAPGTGTENDEDGVRPDGLAVDSANGHAPNSPAVGADKELERKKDQKDNRRYRKRNKSNDNSPHIGRRSGHDMVEVFAGIQE